MQLQRKFWWTNDIGSIKKLQRSGLWIDILSLRLFVHYRGFMCYMPLLLHRLPLFLATPLTSRKESYFILTKTSRPQD